MYQELENVVERATTLSGKSAIDIDDLPSLQAPPVVAAAPTEGLPLSEAKRLITDRFEREAIASALQASGGNVTRAAAALGLARSALQRLLKRHSLEPKAYRS